MTDAPKRSRAHAVAFGALLTFAMAASTVAPFVLGVLGPLIMADFGSTRAQLGLLTTALFVVGALFSPVVGPVVDRVGGRAVLMALFGSSALAFAGMVLAPSYGLLLTAAGVGGFALAAANPATNQLVAAAAPHGRRGVLTGVKQSGVQVGAFLAGALLPWGAVHLGWRGVVLLTAAICALGIVPAARVIPRRDVRLVSRRASRAPVDIRFVVLLGGYAFLMGGAVAAIGAYLPLYAHEALGMTVPTAGLVAATAGLVGIVARILWGRAAERAASATVPLTWLTMGAVVSQIGILAAAWVGPWLMWTAAVGYGVTTASWIAVGMMAIVRESGAGATGRVSGFVQLAFYCGFIVCPPVFGAVVDATESYAPAWTAVALAVAGAGAISWRWSVQERHHAGAKALPS